MKIDVDTEKDSRFDNIIIIQLLKDLNNLRSIWVSAFDVVQIFNNSDACHTELRLGV